MSMYDLNPIENKTDEISPAAGTKPEEKKRSPIAAIIAILALVVGFGLGASYYGQFGDLIKGLSLPESAAQKAASTVDGQNRIVYEPQTTQEDAVIKVVKDYSPAVVSIIITKDVPVYEQYYSAPSNDFDPFGFWGNFQVPQVRQKGTQSREVGAGSGFIVSEDGMVITNKHVVNDSSAEYTVITVDGKKYPAKVLAFDPTQDVAVVKITGAEGQKFPAVKLGDSSNLQIGQSVIAIGNALGEFNNTVSVGVISGLQRSITAGGGGTSETLDNLIQTDAAINEGNSGGPLLNLKGEVIGVNTATASGAQNIGFVLPVNVAKRDIDQVKNTGKITYPYLGIYYTTVDSRIQQENKLPVDYGAWITTGDSGGKSKIASVVAGSPAQKAGLKDQDIILEINDEKIAQTNPLAQIIAKYNPGDKVILKVQRGVDQINADVVLGDRSENQ
ncbi:MAG: trypsin-like peptidase domain-containing protein [Minisyncoccales bacterium]